MLKVPSDFIVDGEPLGDLRGTLVVLHDAGFTDDECMNWLLNDEDSLGTTPVAALQCGPQGRGAPGRAGPGLLSAALGCSRRVTVSASAVSSSRADRAIGASFRAAVAVSTLWAMMRST